MLLGFKVSTAVRQGDVRELIVESAAKWPADLDLWLVHTVGEVSSGSCWAVWRSSLRAGPAVRWKLFVNQARLPLQWRLRLSNKPYDADGMKLICRAGGKSHPAPSEWRQILPGRMNVNH